MVALSKTHRIFSARSFADSDSSNDDDVIRGVSLITVGDAKGHGVQVDSTLLSQLLELGKKFQTGVRANLGHFTGMGDAFGFFDNLRIVGQKLLGDLHLFREYEKYALIKRQIATIPDTFGFSLFFDGPDEEKEEEINGAKVKIAFARATDWFSADCVDCPAANPSGVFISGPTARGQIDDSVDIQKKVTMADEPKQDAPDIKKEISDMLAKHADHMSKMNDRMDEMCQRLANGTNDTPVKDDKSAADLEDEQGKVKDSTPGNPGGSAMADDDAEAKKKDEDETDKKMSRGSKPTVKALSAEDRSAIEANIMHGMLKTLSSQKISPPASATAGSPSAENALESKPKYKTFHEACRGIHALSNGKSKVEAMKLAETQYPDLYKAYCIAQENGESWTREPLFMSPEKHQRRLSIIANGGKLS